MKKQSENLTDAALLRQKAEEQLSQRKPETKKMVSETDMLKMIHELEVHQIELEMQNEVLTIAKEKAELAEEKYTELYDFAPSGYFTLSRHGIILEMNLHGAQMLGKERSLLINRRFGLFIKEDSRIVFANFLEEIFQGKNNAICDVPLSCEDNSSLYVHLTGIISDNKEQCRLTAIDITELKRAEDELRKNLAKYQVLIDTLPIAITISDPEGNIVETNKKAIELLGLPREEHLKRKIKGEDWKIIRTDGTIFPQDEYASVKALNENRLVENIEMGIVKPNEEITWVNVTAAPIPIKEFGVLIAYNDITNRKKADEALHERTELLQNITNHMFDMIAITDLTGVFTYTGPSHRILGFEPEQLLGTSVFEYVHPEDANYIAYEFREFLTDPSPDTTRIAEYRQRCRDGSYLWLETMGKILFHDNGTPSSLFFSSRNITERKKSERALIESEHFANAIASTTPALLYLYDFEKEKNIWTNEVHKRFFEDLKKDSANFDFTEISQFAHPDDFRKLMKLADEILNNTSINHYEIEQRLRWNGAWKWMKLFISVFKRHINGKPIQILGALFDIDDQKKIEQDLFEAKEIAEESEAKLKEAQRIAHLGNWALNIETNELFWSDEIYRIFDCEPHEIKATYEVFLEFIHPDDREKVNSAYLKSLETKTEYQIEHRIITKNNQLKYVKEKCTTTFNEQGKPLSSFGIVIDITESKQAEMFAIKERAISDTIIDSTPGTFYMLDANGRYVRWNAYQRDEIVGKPDSMMPDTNAIDTIHPEDRDLIGSRIGNVLKNGVAETFESRVLLQGGPEFRWMIMTGRRIVIEEKPYLLGIGMDITDRKKAEQALMEKMEELERFFKLTVGREIIMIELKKEVNYLLNKVGEDNKYNIVE